jgi:hypothetical protein
MGEAELDIEAKSITIHSHIVIYGAAADPALAGQLREEIETLWNEPQAIIHLHQQAFDLRFRITGEYRPDLSEMEVLQNLDPRNNYFRVEEYVHGNISFVDGLGCNSGYFKLENLYKGSTTAAHEYGHTLGLDHPEILDIRGTGVPGIMFPRGTLVDPPFQYDPAKPAGVTGGTMHPMHRRVSAGDIALLRLNKLRFENGRSIVGGFTNIYHWPHSPADEVLPGIVPVFG